MECVWGFSFFYISTTWMCQFLHTFPYLLICIIYWQILVVISMESRTALCFLNTMWNDSVKQLAYLSPQVLNIFRLRMLEICLLSNFKMCSTQCISHAVKLVWKTGGYQKVEAGLMGEIIVKEKKSQLNEVDNIYFKYIYLKLMWIFNDTIFLH